VLNKLIEEAAELTEARQQGDKSEIEAEFGDLLFALVNLGRHMGVSAEEALRLAGDRFTNRFSRMEQLLTDQGLNLQAANLEQMEQAWQNAKKEEQSKG